MACERYRDALTDVAAGEPATAYVGAHLASCEACRAELHTLRRALAVADAEMAALAAAEPSPGLAAGIRKAAAEPSPGWQPVWLWPAVAAAATLLVALAVMLERGTGPAPQAREAVDVVQLQPTAQALVAEPLDEDAAPADEPAFAGALQGKEPTPPVIAQGEPRFTRAGARDDKPPEPEVLVPPGEGEALLRFVALVHRDRMAPALFGAAGEPSAEIADLAAIDIQPLEIVPLDPAETSGT